MQSEAEEEQCIADTAISYELTSEEVRKRLLTKPAAEGGMFVFETNHQDLQGRNMLADAVAAIGLHQVFSPLEIPSS